ALVAGAISLGGWWLWESNVGHGTLALKIGAVFVPAFISGCLYWMAALAFKIPEAAEILEFALVRFKRKK
ncbi:MAG TPA: hypothetical protein VNU95_16035, partial [Candidatus Acidoferrales bacterium]|nr:hypothetical protein [Candidatus Acidoferrales bacterium]